MIVEAAKLDITQYTVQYELLRSQVIGSAGNVSSGNAADQRRGVGLALFLSEGMPGWLRDCGNGASRGACTASG